MNLQQLRYVCEIAQRGLNISAAAAALNTNQPGISKQIRQLEAELGLTIFERSRNRISGITPLGQQVVELAQDVMNQIAQISAIGRDPVLETSGALVVATSHTQARYVLPDVLRRFTARFPGVSLTLRHANPAQITEMLLSGEADLGVTTETERIPRALIGLPCRRFERVLMVPAGHPLLAKGTIALADVAAGPLVAYESVFTGRRVVDRAFAAAGLTPRHVLTAIDADVMKKCVENGLGITVLSEVTFEAARDTGLRAIPVGHLFEPSITSVALRRQRRMRRYEYDFIAMCGPAWTRARIQAALATPTNPPLAAMAG